MFGVTGSAYCITLKECIDAALLNNPELKKSRAEFNSFKERKQQSLAGLLYRLIYLFLEQG